MLTTSWTVQTLPREEIFSSTNNKYIFYEGFFHSTTIPSGFFEPIIYILRGRPLVSPTKISLSNSCTELAV